MYRTCAYIKLMKLLSYIFNGNLTDFQLIVQPDATMNDIHNSEVLVAFASGGYVVVQSVPIFANRRNL